jgi:hypothetical protein
MNKITLLTMIILSALILGIFQGFANIATAQASSALPAPEKALQLQDQPTPTPTTIPDLDGYTEQELEAGRPIGIIIGASALIAILFGSVILGYSLSAGAKNKND